MIFCHIPAYLPCHILEQILSCGSYVTSISKVTVQTNSEVITGTSGYSIEFCRISYRPWWRHQMETFSALLAICAGNSPVPGEFPTQRPVTRSFDVFLDLRWVNNREAGDLRRYRPHYDVTVMRIGSYVLKLLRITYPFLNTLECFIFC